MQFKMQKRIAIIKMNISVLLPFIAFSNSKKTLMSVNVHN